MNPRSSNRGVRRFVPGLLLILIFISVGLVLFFFIAASPASASIVGVFSSPVPTRENLWAHAEIAKPANILIPTALPTTVLPTDTAVPTIPAATETPASLTMDIVEDTAVPPQGAQDQVNPPAPSYGGSKYILVDISEQHMYVYEGDTLIYSFVASTGMNNATRVGKFAVQSKIPNAWGSTWSIWMPDWLGIYWAGSTENGIHALPILPNGATLWAGFLGRPISYGCVVLGTYDAQVLYNWAEIGTPVEIRW